MATTYRRNGKGPGHAKRRKYLFFMGESVPIASGAGRAEHESKLFDEVASIPY